MPKMCSTNSYLHVEKCVGNMIPRHQPNRMLPTCWADIVDMSVTDTNVCPLGGVANRHKSRLYQPRLLLMAALAVFVNNDPC
jgi:hypothetical protein